MDASALILFVDVYGFARFVEPDVIFDDPSAFMTHFRDVLRKHSGDHVFFDELESGAMLVRELPVGRGRAEQALLQFQGLIAQVEADFKQVCNHFADQIKRPGYVRLGWSIVRGVLQWADGDAPRDLPRGRPVSTYGTIRICSRSPAEAA